MEKIEREIKRYNLLIVRLKELKKNWTVSILNGRNLGYLKDELKDIIPNLKYSRDFIIFYSKKNNCAIELIDITYFKGKKYYN